MKASQKIAKLQQSIDLQNRTIRNLESMTIPTEDTIATCRLVIAKLEAQISIVKLGK